LVSWIYFDILGVHGGTRPEQLPYAQKVVMAGGVMQWRIYMNGLIGVQTEKCRSGVHTEVGFLGFRFFRNVVRIQIQVNRSMLMKVTQASCYVQ
jgi:hypothetical protein